MCSKGIKDKRITQGKRGNLFYRQRQSDEIVDTSINQIKQS